MLDALLFRFYPNKYANKNPAPPKNQYVYEV